MNHNDPRTITTKQRIIEQEMMSRNDPRSVKKRIIEREMMSQNDPRIIIDPEIAELAELCRRIAMEMELEAQLEFEDPTGLIYKKSVRVEEEDIENNLSGLRS